MRQQYWFYGDLESSMIYEYDTEFGCMQDNMFGGVILLLSGRGQDVFDEFYVDFCMRI